MRFPGLAILRNHPIDWATQVAFQKGEHMSLNVLIEQEKTTLSELARITTPEQIAKIKGGRSYLYRNIEYPGRLHQAWGHNRSGQLSNE